MKNPDTPVNNVNTKHALSEFEESCRANWHQFRLHGRE